MFCPGSEAILSQLQPKHEIIRTWKSLVNYSTPHLHSRYFLLARAQEFIGIQSHHNCTVIHSPIRLGGEGGSAPTIKYAAAAGVRATRTLSNMAAAEACKTNSFAFISAQALGYKVVINTG